MLPDELEKAIASGDVAACLALMGPASALDRRAAAPAVLAAYKEGDQWYRNRRFGLKDAESVLREQRYKAALLALMGTATLSEIKKLNPIHWDARIYDVLAARRPEWLQDWCEWVLGDHGSAWNAVRRMVRERLCERPASDMYLLWILELGAGISLKNFLLQDPELMEVELWRLFLIEGNSRISFSNVDKFSKPKQAWARTLVELAGEEKLSRARLLDASLDALECDYAQYRAGWFSRFHEMLKPSAEERSARADRYLRLLTSKIPPTVSFALNAVCDVYHAGSVSPAHVLDAMPPVFYAKEKSTLLKGIRLLQECVKAQPPLQREALRFLVPALENGSVEVQEIALSFLARQLNGSDPGLLELVKAVAPGAAPSVREKIATLCGEQAAGTADASTDSAPQPKIGKLAPSITTVEELVRAFSGVIENEGPPEEIERVLDAVSRLCGEPPADFDRLTSPLRKRSESFITRYGSNYFSGFAVRPVLCGLVRAWLGREAPAQPSRRAPGLAGFLAERVRELASRVALANPNPLLATPSEPDGTIDPMVLVKRMTASSEIGMLDAIQSLLRLNENGRAEALSAAKDIKGEPGEAIRYALGSANGQIGATAALWIAASRARNFRADDDLLRQFHPDHGPDTDRAGTSELTWQAQTHVYEGKTYTNHSVLIAITPKLPQNPDISLPTVLSYRTAGEAPVLRWAATVWPGNREGWYVSGCREIGNNLDWWQAHGGPGVPGTAAQFRNAANADGAEAHRAWSCREGCRRGHRYRGRSLGRNL